MINAGKGVTKWQFLNTVGEATMETKKVEIELSCDPARPLLDTYPIKPIFMQRYFHILIHCCFSHNRLEIKRA